MYSAERKRTYKSNFWFSVFQKKWKHFQNYCWPVRSQWKLTSLMMMNSGDGQWWWVMIECLKFVFRRTKTDLQAKFLASNPPEGVEALPELLLACQAPMETDRPGGEWGDEEMMMMTHKTYEICLPYLSTNKTIDVLCCVWSDSAPSIERIQDGFVASTAYRYTSSPAILDCWYLNFIIHDVHSCFHLKLTWSHCQNSMWIISD